MPATLDPALPDEVLDAAETVLQLAHDSGLKLATAGSCTGGLLAALLTDVPGRSHVFERGFAVYSEDAKCDLLGIALSITGFAGPAGPDDEEGLVHLACARRDSVALKCEKHFGPIGRQVVRIAAFRTALSLLETALRR